MWKSSFKNKEGTWISVQRLPETGDPSFRKEARETLNKRCGRVRPDTNSQEE